LTGTVIIRQAYADKLVPTITCTSSNVVATVLQAAAQVPDLHVWYCPHLTKTQTLGWRWL